LKKKSEDEEDFDEDEEEEEEEEDEDFDDEDDEDEEVCPHGCDQTLYDKVLALREKRLDQEDVIAECAKAIDGFKKERDSLGKKAKTNDTSLKAGAYTRPLSSSTSAVSDTKYTLKHPLLSPDTPQTPPQQPLHAPPIPQKPLTLS
jgi:hypothetical protein